MKHASRRDLVWSSRALYHTHVLTRDNGDLLRTKARTYHLADAHSGAQADALEALDRKVHASTELCNGERGKQRGEQRDVQRVRVGANAKEWSHAACPRMARVHGSRATLALRSGGRCTGRSCAQWKCTHLRRRPRARRVLSQGCWS